MTTIYDYETLQKKAEHLDNILKIIKYGGYDEVICYRIMVYCEWKKLIDYEELDYSELEMVQEIIKND